jgi:hypothetical protein
MDPSHPGNKESGEPYLCLMCYGNVCNRHGHNCVACNKVVCGDCYLRKRTTQFDLIFCSNECLRAPKKTAKLILEHTPLHKDLVMMVIGYIL